jgi:PAS domain S-box-containing protein
MYVELSAQYTADGFVTGICHDITQRKRTEIALQQSEERYRRLIEQASDGVLIFSKEYHCLDANTSACEMTGYARHELIGMNLLGLIDPQDLHANPPQVEKLRIGEKTITERKMRKKDGTIFYGESVVQIMPDGHIVSFLRNITQRKKSELARQRSEQTYRVLFQQSPLPMFVVNYQTLRIIAANDAAIHFYGYTKDDFLSLTAFDLRPPEDQAAYLEKMQHATEGVMKMGISRHIKKDGNVVEVEIYSHHFGYEGKHYRLVLALDVTEKQKAARELIDTTSQLRELSDHLQTIRENERTKISREIHDELGQQLTILKMDISWMHQKLKSYNNTELVERSEEALNMLNDTIKTVRRIATELRPSLLDDLGLAAALEWQSKEFESRSGIKITFTSNVTSLPIKNAVATSLFRIYQEALTNVARHAKASHVTCSLALTNEQLVLTIKDDGRGFDMQTTDNKKTLGLLGMKERTLMMGGYFNITSAAGEGTTITVKTSIN